MRILRRFGLIGQRPQLVKNKQWLRKRQAQQLGILQMFKNNVELSLLNCKIEDLVKMKNEKVFNTFTTRCLKPEIRALNALADVNIQGALQKRGQQKIPFSVKDQLKVEGMISTCGFSDNITPSLDSSDVVVLLQNEGCVPFTHTNVPQGLLGIQSTNPLYGTAYNPHNPSFLSGGSSGGEGALVACKATAFGIGSDSGGSARMPAAFCGIYGYKPTGSKRLSLKGRLSPNGMESLKFGDLDPSMGFLTRSIEDLVWLCSKTLGKTIQGPPLYGGEWNQARYQAARRKKLRVGYMYNNPQMKMATGIINTIEETLQHLRNKKHEVVEFKYQKLEIFRNYFFKFVHISGFLNGLCKRMDGDTISPQALPFYDLKLFGKLGIKNKLKNIPPSILRQLMSYYLKQQTLLQFFMIHKELVEHKKSFLKEWKDKEIDVLVTPVMPFTALYPGSTELLIYQLTYCCFQNVLELPAGVIPTRFVLPNETQYEPHTPFEHAGAASIRNSAGMPLAIQVSGEHLKDQECLGAMWQISKLNGKYLQPPI